jgi:hypothetical protein
MSNLSPTRQEMIRLLNEVEKLNKGEASKNKCVSYFPVSSPLHITLITFALHTRLKKDWRKVAWHSSAGCRFDRDPASSAKGDADMLLPAGTC